MIFDAHMWMSRRRGKVINMDMIEYFEQRKRHNEEQLAAFEAGQFKLFQVTTDGDVDVTEVHKERIRDAIKSYALAAEMLRGPPVATFPNQVLTNLKPR